MIMKAFWKFSFSLVQSVFDVIVHCFCKAEDVVETEALLSCLEICFTSCFITRTDDCLLSIRNSSSGRRISRSR